MLKKIKCKVCGHAFHAHAGLRYEAKLKPDSISPLSKSVEVAECFDCPRCGCQKIVNIRHQQAVGIVIVDEAHENNKEPDKCL